MLQHLEQQQRLTRNQYRIVFAGALADMLNFYDFFLIGYVLAFLLGSWRLSYGQTACVLLASSIGAIPGALVWGRWADRVGRRRVLLATALNISLASAAMALTPAQGWVFLTICQFVFGFGFAGLHTVVIPLVQEFMPTRKRGWAGGMVVTGISVAALLNAAAGAALAPLIGGWRGLAALGVVPVLAVVLIRAWVPESPRWLARQGRIEEARRALAWALHRDLREIEPPPPTEGGRTAWREVFHYL